MKVKPKETKHVTFSNCSPTLASSQSGQPEHLLKGQCVVLWVLNAQDFRYVQGPPHSIQHRGRVSACHV